MAPKWKKLQNGSDIRGVALDGVEGEPVNLSAPIAKTLGCAFAKWLKSQNEKACKVAVGTDSRLSGPELKKAFIEGLVLCGFDVVDCGIASTPAMFMSTIDEALLADGGVMLTASHLPFNRNGLKFFTAQGGLDKKDITAILEIANEWKDESGQGGESGPKGQVSEFDFISAYSRFLVETIRAGVGGVEQPMKGLKIIVDAGNGSGGFFADKVLVPLGADVSGSQFLDPDGNFPNHVPNPEDPDAMASICGAVLKEQADLGIIFDTDVDRSAMVDAAGQPINRNDLIALISTVILEEHPGSIVVTDSITSEGLKVFIEEQLKGCHHRFKRGYKNVINESKRLNEEGKESWLAIETSGHAALKENHFLDDGAYLVAKLLIKMAQLNQKGQTLSDLIVDLARPVEEKEFRFSIECEDFGTYGEKVLEQLQEKAQAVEGWEIEVPNHEGLRIRCTGADECGWFLLRMSLHDPVMPLNIESTRTGGVEVIRQKLQQLLTGYANLNISSLLK